MKAALEAQAEGKFLLTNTKDCKSAGFISRAPAEAYSIGYEEEMSATLRSGLTPDVIQAEACNVTEQKAFGICSRFKDNMPAIVDTTHCDDVVRIYNDASPTMRSRDYKGGIYVFKQVEIFDMPHSNDVIRKCGDTCSALAARMGTGGNQIPLVFDPTYCIQGNTIERSDTAGANGKGVIEGNSYTLNTVDRHAVCHSVGFCPDNSSTAAGLSEEDEKSPTLSVTKKVAACYTIGNGQADQTKLHDVAGALNCMHDQQGVIYAIDRAAFNQGENAKYDFQIEDDGVNSTIVARGPSAVCYNSSLEGIAGTLDASYYKDCGVRGNIEREFIVTPNNIQNLAIWIVRRLTPRECERLQGFKDDWTMYDASGSELKDTPRYKALGNSIAIPCAMRVFQGIMDAEKAKE